MVKNVKSLSKVKKTRVLTEKGCFLLLQEICVCAYIGPNVILTVVRAIFGVEYHCFLGPEKGRKWGFCEISLNVTIYPSTGGFMVFGNSWVNNNCSPVGQILTP